MIRLIVNADDFGMTSGINRAILELHKAGILTSATLMARATATDEALEIAQATPSLGVGCHVVLVDGEPVAGGYNSLVVGGRFRPTLGAFLRAIFTGAILERDIEAEARAQIQYLQTRDVALTHIDTHKHTHMFPRVLRPVLRAARVCGIRVVRNPFEPQWGIAATPGALLVRRVQVRMLRMFESRFRRVVAEEGLTTTDGSIGVLATGTLDAATITSLLRAAPAQGTYELVTHPGYNDAELGGMRTRLRESRETEREALLHVSEFSQAELISFAALK